jgi:signal transduction histidine kinase
MQPVYRNRPTLSGFFVRPRQQLRLAFLVVTGLFLVNSLLAALLIYDIDNLTPGWIVGYVLLATIVLSLYVVAAGMIISHRIFGPIVSLKRHIASLREGQYTARLQLRQTDDLAELKDALNDLAVALENRHGSGPRIPS